jgi:hypothetical protein
MRPKIVGIGELDSEISAQGVLWTGVQRSTARVWRITMPPTTLNPLETLVEYDHSTKQLYLLKI